MKRNYKTIQSKPISISLFGEYRSLEGLVMLSNAINSYNKFPGKKAYKTTSSTSKLTLFFREANLAVSSEDDEMSSKTLINIQ